MKIMNSIKILGLSALAVAIATGCATSAVKAPAANVAATPGGTVTATLTDMKISLDRATINAGQVTFVVKNAGAVAHELVVLQTKVSADKLAPNADEAGKMDETGNIGETGDMEVGGTKTFTVMLPAGSYVLMCNEVGHYASGMRMAFIVN